MNEQHYNALKQAVADRAKVLRSRIALAERMGDKERKFKWESENFLLHQAFLAIKAEFRP